MSEIKLGYTTIQHGPRLAFGLSMSEYSLAAAIFHLSHNPRAAVPGWCYASKKKLAAFFGFSERTIFNLLDSLVAGGWVERHPEQVEGGNGLVRTTAAWYDKVECWQVSDTSGLPVTAAPQIADPMQKFHTPPMQDFQGGYEKSADNSNTNNNTLDNNVFRKRGRGAENPGSLKDNPTDASHTGGAGCENPDTTIKTAPEVIALADEIAALFKVSETKFFHQYAKVRRFVKDLHAQGRFDDVQAQFHAYRADRLANRTRVHNLDNWLGTAESGWLVTGDHKTAAWAEKDWVATMLDQNAQAASQPPKETGRKTPASHLNQRQDGAAAALERLRRKAQTDPENSLYEPETSASYE